MIEIAPGFKVERFELNIYEDVNSKTNTNDTVIYREFADSEIDRDKMMEKAANTYKGFKYKLTDYSKKSRKNKIGIL